METRHAESEGRPALWVLGLLWLIAVGGWFLAPPVGIAGSAEPRANEPGPVRGGGLAPELLSVQWLDLLPDGEPASLADGDTLRVDTYWNRGGLTIVANAAALDTNFTSVPLVASAEADSVYRLEFTSAELRSDGSKVIPLTVTASDLDSTYVFEDLAACVSNLGPRLLSLTTLPARTRYRANDLLRIDSRWSVPFGPGTLVADLSAIEPSGDGLIEGDSIGVSHFLVTYRIPLFSPDQAGDYVIPLVCRNELCGATVDRSLTITLDAETSIPPVLVDWEVLAPLDGSGQPRPLVNGDTIRLLTRWDRAGLAVSADAYEIAPADTIRPAVLEVGPGEYEIIYTVPQDNARQDGADLPFRLIAEGLDGESTIDSSVRFCLSNHRPVHFATRLLEEREIYRGGDLILAQSQWISGSRLPLTLDFDVSRLGPGTAPKLGELVDTIGDSLYVFELFDQAAAQPDFGYQIPTQRDDRGPDGEGILLPITCRETGGCAVVRLDDLLQIDMDTTAPDTTGPVLDPLPVSETTEDSILVSGVTVPEAARVALSRQNNFFAYTSVDSSTGRFSGWVRLVPNEENALRAWAEDELGNRTRSSDPEFVRHVSSLLLDFEQPFLRDGEILVSDPGGIRDLRLGIYDLEGRLVREWRDPGPILRQSWIWDGTDAEGDPVRQGYFLIRATWRRSDGRNREETTGLVLGD